MTTLEKWLSLPPGTIVQFSGEPGGLWPWKVLKLADSNHYDGITDYMCVTVAPDGGHILHISELIDFRAEFIGQFTWES
jgi:hypothetical protein